MAEERSGQRDPQQRGRDRPEVIRWGDEDDDLVVSREKPSNWETDRYEPPPEPESEGTDES